MTHTLAGMPAWSVRRLNRAVEFPGARTHMRMFTIKRAASYRGSSSASTAKRGPSGPATAEPRPTPAKPRTIARASDPLQNESMTASGPNHTERAFWDRHSGIHASAAETAKASSANAAAAANMDSSSRSVQEVAHRLGLSPSAVRRYVSLRKLYAYTSMGRLIFPAWQFHDARNETIPSLADVLERIPTRSHPQTVSGFFLTPQPDLSLQGRPVSPKEWLEAGKDFRVVASMAAELSAGY